MRGFIDPGTLDPVPATVVRRLAEIDQAAGQERFHQERTPRQLSSLARRARVESAIASSAIEGIAVPRKAADAVLQGKRPPSERNEFELAGYQAALDDLYDEPVQNLSVPRLLGWHRLLMNHLGPSVAGRLKTTDNVVVDVLPDGGRRTRFAPTSARETPQALQELCERFEEARLRDEHHPIILIAAAVLDFLVIHPFEDGNGRVARLLTTALTEQAGYRIGRYCSIEQLVHDRRTEYYQTLRASTKGWHQSEHTLWPWASFLINTLELAYSNLEETLGQSHDRHSIRQDLEHWVQQDAPATFSASAVRRAFPHLSASAVSSMLADMRDRGLLSLSGTGRGARWTRQSTHS